MVGTESSRFQSTKLQFRQEKGQTHYRT